MRLLLVALLILSGASIVTTLSGTPAFDASARKDTVLGGWRVAANTALYDEGTYAFQRGYGFLAADALISAETEARDELASAETAETRALQAIDALEYSLSLDPGNAHAWASLSWAYARVGQNHSAVTALRTSWALAPYNRVIADTRFTLLGILTTPGLSTVRLTSADMLSLRRDIASLRQFDQTAIAFHIGTMPHLANLVRLAQETG